MHKHIMSNQRAHGGNVPDKTASHTFHTLGSTEAEGEMNSNDTTALRNARAKRLAAVFPHTVRTDRRLRRKWGSEMHPPNAPRRRIRPHDARHTYPLSADCTIPEPHNNNNEDV